MVWDFCFWAVWVAELVLKKKFGAHYEQLLKPVFVCFHGQKINLKNVVKCYKDFFGYFNALKTHCVGVQGQPKIQQTKMPFYVSKVW